MLNNDHIAVKIGRWANNIRGIAARIVHRTICGSDYGCTHRIQEVHTMMDRRVTFVCPTVRESALRLHNAAQGDWTCEKVVCRRRWRRICLTHNWADENRHYDKNQRKITHCRIFPYQRWTVTSSTPGWGTLSSLP